VFFKERLREMKLVLNACLILLWVSSIFAQGGQTKDPVSGVWGDPAGIGFDLKYDGKRKVSGTIRVENSAGKSTELIKNGTFNRETGELTLEGEAKRPDGVLATFVIKGKIAGDKVTGTYKFSEAEGEFTFTRQPNDGKKAPPLGE